MYNKLITLINYIDCQVLTITFSILCQNDLVLMYLFLQHCDSALVFIYIVNSGDKITNEQNKSTNLQK